jgi:hypothetical protein
VSLRRASYSLVIVALAFCSMGGECTLGAPCAPAAPPPCRTNPACVHGIRLTGSSSCQAGTWVCESVACISDAGACDGLCSDSGSD